jgi:hypothetical protein
VLGETDNLLLRRTRLKIRGVLEWKPRAGVEERRHSSVESTQLAELESHPALFVRLMITFDNLDSRQFQTQLRQITVDLAGLKQVVPAGDRGLIIQGLGADSAALVKLLREVDAASAARPAPAPAPAPAAKEAH